MSKKKAPPKRTAKDKGRGTCFVIMPFGGYFDGYYEQVYKPAIEEAGLRPVRADLYARSTQIVSDIRALTEEAEIVLAELTTKNANVFYELGIAHALRKPTVLIAQSMDDVPFDLRGMRIQTYDLRVPRWADKLSSGITRAIQETMEDPASGILQPFLNVAPGEAAEVSELEALRYEVHQSIARLQQELESFRTPVPQDPRFDALLMDAFRNRRQIASAWEPHQAWEPGSVLVSVAPPDPGPPRDGDGG